MKHNSPRFYVLSAIASLSVLGILFLSVSALVPTHLAFGEGERNGCADMVFGSGSYTGPDGMSDSVYSLHGITGSLGTTSKCFGASGSSLRLGSSSSAGSFTFNFTSPVIVKKAKVLAYSYSSSDTPSLSFQTSAVSETSMAVTATSAPDITDASTDVGYIFTGLDQGNNTASTSFRVSSVSKRVCLCKIVFTLGSGTGTSTATSSSVSSASVTLSSSSVTTPSSSASSPSSSGTTSSAVTSSVSSNEGTYYLGISWTQSGETLRSSLHNLIASKTIAKSYDYAYTAYETTDVDANGKIIDIYSNYHYDPSTQHENGSGVSGLKGDKEGDMYNREHTVPQSIFNEALPMKSDLHHLYPTDKYVNNRRSNYPHAIVKTSKWTSQNGSKLGDSDSTANFGLSASNVFEPIDEYKGDIARTYFYMATRYSDKCGSWGSYAVFSNGNLASWARSLYLEWSKNDPVSSKEIARNNAIYGIQNNRNPFIDHPEAAEKIWG